MKWIVIIEFIASIITIVAVWGRIYNIYYNCRHFWKGGLRITFHSGVYLIKGNGGNGKIIFQSSSNDEDFICYAENGKRMHLSSIKPFRKWKLAYWSDDIRVPNYPLHWL